MRADQLLSGSRHGIARNVDYEAIVEDLQAHRAELAKIAITDDGTWHEWDAVQRAIYSLQRAEALRIQREVKGGAR